MSCETKVEVYVGAGEGMFLSSTEAMSTDGVRF
jgi:hypothetical protein